MSIEKKEQIDYTAITESPGLKATQEQIVRLYQRYHFARQFAESKDVLEVACGSGMGLGYLARVAKKVVEGDIDDKNVALAKKYYKAEFRIQKAKGKIEIDLMDAHELPLPDRSVDLVILFETIYYLQEPEKFISEAERVLRENSILIICTVNKDWEDFHPSPYSYKYFSVPELYELLKNKFQEIRIYGGFRIENKGVKHNIISLIKRFAVEFSLIPGSLKARAYLKRIFLGKLMPLPDEVYEDNMAPYEPPVPIPVDKINKDFKIIYALAR